MSDPHSHAPEQHKHTVEEHSEGFPDLEDAQPSDKSKRDAVRTPEEIELHWFRTVYQGDVPQLTLKAVVTGSIIGGFMSLSNLYVGLKTGWGLGVSITASILSYAFYKALTTAFPKTFSEPTLLENNCMQTTASSAGYSTGGTMVSAIAAYLLITGAHMNWHVLAAWTFFLALFGVFLAIPMKRQMINVEQLRFPTGIATAETLKSLCAKGGEAMLKARALAYSGVGGGLIAWMRDAGIPLGDGKWLKMPASIPFGGLTLGGFPLAKWTIQFDMSAIMIAAGAIMGWKVAWSLLLGATINYGILAPWAVKVGAIPISPDGADLGYRAIVRWSTWAGASLMVTSALFAFSLQWRSIGRVFSGVAAAFTKKKSDVVDPLEAIEVPGTWFVGGVLVSGLGCMVVLNTCFGTTWWMSLVAIALTFLLAVVACRVTGETDTTPIGAMGKITQLTFGVLAPSNMVTNLMTASVTAGGAGTAADLLTGLKSGYLLGANPRKQFLAQLLGVFAGTLIVVPAFYILVPTVDVLGSDKWPAPAAQVWAAVARLLKDGFGALHPTARWGLLFGGLVGIAIPALELAFPKARKYIPSATGIGLSMVIPFFNSLSMFIGALITLYLEKKHAKFADEYVVPVSSGFIAGESLLGVLIALLAAATILPG
ncbi:MAG: OPT family oligopeptide transporter [Elusimicrobiota bacterium]|jgi:OPT family oligopeptide transporter